MEQTFRDTEVRSPPRKDRHMLIDDTVSRHTTTVAPPAPPATQTSTTLYNQDLAPTKAEGRRWGRYSIFALWTNDVHNIANYSFAIGLYALGPGRLADSAVPGHRRGAGLRCFMNLSGLHGPEDRRAVPGHQPDQFRNPRRADSCIDPRRHRHRLVRNPDLPGVGGLRVLLTRRRTPGSPTTTTTRSSACRAWDGCVSSAIWLVQMVDPRLRHGDGAAIRERLPGR